MLHGSSFRFALAGCSAVALALPAPSRAQLPTQLDHFFVGRVLVTSFDTCANSDLEDPACFDARVESGRVRTTGGWGLRAFFAVTGTVSGVTSVAGRDAYIVGATSSLLPEECRGFEGEDEFRISPDDDVPYTLFGHPFDECRPAFAAVDPVWSAFVPTRLIVEYDVTRTFEGEEGEFSESWAGFADAGGSRVELAPTTVPEPSTFALAAGGLVALVSAARRRRP